VASATSLTPAQWLAVRKRALARALELTRSLPRAKQLVQDAMGDVFEGDEEHPWNQETHPDVADYVCDRVWSRFGNETTSYRVTLASERLDAAKDEGIPPSDDPASRVIDAHTKARAERLKAALLVRIANDPLIMLLLEEVGEDEREEAEQRDPSMNAEAVTTRRALAKGYTEEEIKNARLRLKRHAHAVVREEENERKQKR
jgi:hypothetical protein